MKNLIITANLSQIRVLKVRPQGDDPIEQQHLSDETRNSTGHPVQPLQEIVTDQFGRFGRGERAGFEHGMSIGEEHHLQDEIRRLSVKELAKQINQVLATHGYPRWTLAAPKALLRPLQNMLAPPVRQSLGDTIGADLTHLPLAKLEHRFCPKYAPS